MAIANAAVRYIFRHSADRLRMDLSNRNKQIWNMFIFVYFKHTRLNGGLLHLINRSLLKVFLILT